MELVDSHAHLDSYDDLPGVLERAGTVGVRTILAIGIGDGPATMHRALEIAKADRLPGEPQIYASAGIHPQEAHHATPEHLTKMATLLDDPLCVACGEIGLDYYHVDNPGIATQQAAFVAQMQLAAAARKPILIHCRTSELAKPDAKARYGDADAWSDLLRLITEHWTPTGLPGVMHCFSGGPAEAERSLDAGFTLSFAGNLTYPKAQQIRDAAAAAPADRILVETDAPFLAPVPHRGATNEPSFVRHTATALAGLRGVSAEELAAQTTRNFHTLFHTMKAM
jgi:TatD DNase family protein